MTERASAGVRVGEIIPTPQKDRSITGKSQAFTSSKAEEMKNLEIHNLK